jgi:hypothetical protein
MRLIHEHMPQEAAVVAKTLTGAYGIPVDLHERSLGDCFTPIGGFPGEMLAEAGVDALLAEHPKKAMLVLSNRNLYADEAEDPVNDYLFSSADYDPVFFLSAARLKGTDWRLPPSSLVSQPQYHARLAALAISTVADGLIENKSHFWNAWYKPIGGGPMELGMHCADSACIMYPVADIAAPDPSMGHIELRKRQQCQKLYDCGLDEMLDRISLKDPFCSPCRKGLRITKVYR